MKQSLDNTIMNQSPTIVFEMPVQATLRDSLCFEELISDAYTHAEQATPAACRAAINIILELLLLLDRPELRSKYFQDFTRYHHSLAKLSDTAAIDSQKLADVSEQLANCLSLLADNNGKFGDSLRSIPFFKTLLQLHQRASANCAFNTPGLHLWLNQTPSNCQQQLLSWLNAFKALQQISQTQLYLVRHAGTYQSFEAIKGYYQQAVDARCQLVRVRIQKDCQLFPKISLGQHGISVQFFHASLTANAIKVADNIPFDMAYCSV